MFRGPDQIPVGMPGPWGCPQIQGGMCLRDTQAVGSSEALERNEVVEGLAVLPEPLESRLRSQEEFYNLKTGPYIPDKVSLEIRAVVGIHWDHSCQLRGHCQEGN